MKSTSTVERLAKDLAGETREHVARTVNPALDRIAALEQAVRTLTIKLDSVKDGQDGQNGKDADMDALTRHLDTLVADAISSLPRPIPEPAIPGPQGEKGEKGDSIPGEPGPPGTDGRDGKDAEPVSLQQVQEVVTTALPGVLQAAVKAYLEDHPPASGKDGAHGRDGVGVAGAVIDRDGHLILTLSDGSQKALGLVVGKDGAPGVKGFDGKDGLGHDDLEEVIEDGGRTLVRRYQRGDHVREFRHKTAIQIYRGMWEDGRTYELGDTVTWGGSMFCAKQETTHKPEVETPSGREHWTLCVARGREGKPGKQGEPGPTGSRGEKGDPGRGHY